MVYLEVMKSGFRRWSTYRAATAAGAFTNTVFGFVLASVLMAVYDQRQSIGGFDATDAVTFTFLAQGFLAPVAMFGWQDIANRVRSGDVVSDLHRPVDFQLWWLAQDMGRAFFMFAARGLPPVLVGMAAFGFHVSPRPLHWAAFTLAALTAVIVSFGVRFQDSCHGEPSSQVSAKWLVRGRR